MCGRFVLSNSRAELVSHFGLDGCADFTPRYNIPPGTDILVVRRSPEARRVAQPLRWGLVPHWSKDPAIGAKLNNARGETVAEKPSFRDAFRRRRCLIPASGFYEWQVQGKLKQPYYISLKSGAPLALAGLWESWQDAAGNLLRSTCIITTGPNAVMAPIHDRMPVIIAPEHWQQWLAAPAEEIASLIAPCAADILQAWPVNRRASKTQEDDARLIQPES